MTCKIRTWSSLTSLLIIILVLFSLETNAQIYSIEFIDTPISEVVNKIESHCDIGINFSSDVIDVSKKISFSAEGNLTTLLSTFFTILDRDYLEIDEKVYVIKPSKLDPKKKVEAPIYTIKITDDKGMALPFAYVKVGKHFYESNPLGLIKIQGFYPSSMLIEFSFFGYHSRKLTVKDLDKAAVVEIQLEEEEHILGEIIIKENRLRPVNTSQQELIDPNNTSVGGIADNDVLSLSLQTPGVFSAGESVNDIQIRGGPPDQVNIKWNGINVLQRSLFFGKVSSINPFMVDQISITKNGSDAESLSQESTGINLNNISRTQDTSTSIQIFSNLLYVNAGLQTNFWDQKINLKVAHRRSYSELFKSGLYNSYFNHSFQIGSITDDQFYAEKYDFADLIQFNPQVEFHDVNAYLSAELHPKLNYNFSLLNVSNVLSYTEESETIENLGSDTLRIQNFGFQNTLEYKDNLFTSTLKYTSSRYNYQFFGYSNYSNLEENILRDQRNALTNNLLALTNTIKLGNQSIQFGLQHERWDLDATDLAFGQDSTEVYLLELKEAYENTIFGQLNFKFKGLSSSLGLRYSRYSLTSYRPSFLEPRIHLSYNPVRYVTFHFHYGKFHQTLQRNYLFTPLQAENAWWFISDESADTDIWVSIPTTEMISGGIRLNFGKISGAIDYYNKSLFNIWTSAYEFTYEENPYLYIDSRIKGLELSIKYHQNNSSLGLGYNYTQDVLITEEGSTFNSPYFQPHRLNINFAHKIKACELSINWQFATGRYFSEPSGFDVREEKGETSYVTLFDEIYNIQSPNYHRLDASLRYSLGFENSQLTLGVNLINLYGRNNIISNQYFTDYRLDEIAPTQFTKFGLGFTPDIFLQYEF